MTAKQPQYAEKLALAERILGHAFSDRDLLLHALTHPSAAEDHDVCCFYERLEFLGDSLLGFIIAEELFTRFPDMPEGGMTRIKVSVVNGHVLSKTAEELGIGNALVLGDSVLGTGGRGITSAMENAFEALTAALYLDAGMDAARKWILRTLGPLIDVDRASVPENPKSVLQEICQAGGHAPAYCIINHEGPPHDRSFTAEVTVAGEVVGSGSGRTKREAEAAAAAAALEHLSK